MWRRTGFAVAAAGALVALSACGSSTNGLASETPTQIYAAASTAVKGATSYELSGTGSFGSGVTAFSFQVRGSDVDGTTTIDGSSIDLIVLSGNVYFKAAAAFWESEGLSATDATLLGGTWVEAPAGSSTAGDFSSVSQATNLSAGLASHGTLASGGTGTADGQSVVFVKDTTNDTTLAVATTGTAYPVQFVNSGSTPYTLTASDWNSVPAFTPPPSPLNLSTLGG